MKKIIAVLDLNTKKIPNFKDTNKEITIYKTEKIETINGDTTTITTKKTPVNLTRKINETAKVLKQMTAQEKLRIIADAIK